MLLEVKAFKSVQPLVGAFPLCFQSKLALFITAIDKWNGAKKHYRLCVFRNCHIWYEVNQEIVDLCYLVRSELQNLNCFFLGHGEVVHRRLLQIIISLNVQVDIIEQFLQFCITLGVLIFVLFFHLLVIET